MKTEKLYKIIFIIPHLHFFVKKIQLHGLKVWGS